MANAPSRGEGRARPGVPPGEVVRVLRGGLYDQRFAVLEGKSPAAGGVEAPARQTAGLPLAKRGGRGLPGVPPGCLVRAECHHTPSSFAASKPVPGTNSTPALDMRTSTPASASAVFIASTAAKSLVCIAVSRSATNRFA